MISFCYASQGLGNRPVLGGSIYYKQAIVLAIRELEEYIQLQTAAVIWEWL